MFVDVRRQQAGKGGVEKQANCPRNSGLALESAVIDFSSAFPYPRNGRPVLLFFL